MPDAFQDAMIPDALTIFQGGGEMGALMRAYNWDAHPLGNPDSWPQSLRTNIRLLLNSEFPMFIWWSKDLYAFHNDAYLPALGKKHPAALGTAARDIWAEIWTDVGGIAENILAGGEPFYAKGLRLYLGRKGFMEETYWTFSYSPAFDDAGNVAGVFCACFEETSTILGQRRLKCLKDIADSLSQIQTLEQACQTTCDLLAPNESDIPFSQIYLLNRSETEARLLGQSGQVVPQVSPSVKLLAHEAHNEWPLAEVRDSRKALVLDDLSGYVVPAQSSATQAVARKAVILPIYLPGQDSLLGFFVSGISPMLEYDTEYQNFHELLTSQIASSIASVRAREEAIRQQNELSELFQQAPVAICILRGPEHVVELANPGICELWGKRHADVIGKPILDALPEVRNQGIKELLDGVFRTGVPYSNNELEVMLERNGILEPMYFSFVYHPMRDRKGTIVGVIAIAIGIKDQVEARREIETMNTELRAINADLDNFVYSASHDLKAPISNIEGLMETLVEYLPAEIRQEEVVQRVLSLMDASVTRFKRAVADLTEVAKIQREAGEDIASLELPEVVADVLLDFENTINATGAQFETQYAPGSTVNFSAKNVRSIVYNLVSNALKYRSPDRTPQVKIKTEEVPGYLVLSVSDNGLGLKSTDHKKIFTMFKRLHDHVEGTGVGLYIVKRIVENAGGTIEVESEKDKGSTFRVFFKR
ncbi:sensor histidine kinase [Rufibacter aurantiacus]|uniref:sensor histidine kinase n=1 Tax=Rufibacter aurantiacus TaxID=2817374 RepID=UPI001FEF8B4E|nr:PAS domain-containing sensor histidine kinase [Rufibacter aurantiacus]